MRKLHEIAADVRKNWKNVYFAAEPYLEAMETLESVEDHYYDDPAREIVIRFLCNTTYWRGDDARRIKAELNKMLKK